VPWSNANSVNTVREGWIPDYLTTYLLTIHCHGRLAMNVCMLLVTVVLYYLLYSLFAASNGSRLGK